MKTKAKDIADLFEDAGFWRLRYREDPTDEPIMRTAGITEDAFSEWVVGDIQDTLENIFGLKDQASVKLSAAELGALIATHIRMAFETGYLYGKGDI